jgi:hypothetical protein
MPLHKVDPNRSAGTRYAERQASGIIVELPLLNDSEVIRALETRLARVEAHIKDLRSARALNLVPAAGGAPEPPALAALEAVVGALEAAPAPIPDAGAVQALAARVAAVEARPAPTPAPTVPADVLDRLAALEARPAALGSTGPAVGAQLAADIQELARVVQDAIARYDAALAAGRMADLEHAAKITRIEAALYEFATVAKWSKGQELAHGHDHQPPG